ncbi:MAG: thioredoxin domain-containing protein [Desulfatibacillaceae bacterium]
MLIPEEIRMLVVLVFAAAGVLFAVLSWLERRVRWVMAFCAFFGDGCRRTQNYTLFMVPISIWGIVYYVGLAALEYVAQPLVYWYVAIGAGMELTFLWILATQRIFCIFCVINALVVVGLFALLFEPVLMWPTFTVLLAVAIVSHQLISRENRSEMGAAPERPPQETPAARVDDTVITMGEVDAPLTGRIHSLRMDIHRLRENRLERLIRDELLDKEARRRGETREELVGSVLPDDFRVDETGVDGFLEENTKFRERFSGTKEQLRERVREILAEREKKRRLDEYVDNLRKLHEVEILLDPPEAPMVRVPVANNPSTGPEDAAVFVVEFSDYLCPACRKAHQVARSAKETFGDQIRWIYKDFPLEDLHPGARKLARAAHCAGDQGAFWEFQDRMFATDRTGDDHLVQVAADLGLDGDEFRKCLESGQHGQRVEQDIEDGTDAGVTATPTFFVNGRLLKGALPEEKFAEVIREELERAG